MIEEELLDEYESYVKVMERDERSRTENNRSPLKILIRRFNISVLLPYEDYKLGRRLEGTSGYYSSKMPDKTLKLWREE